VGKSACKKAWKYAAIKFGVVKATCWSKVITEA